MVAEDSGIFHYLRCRLYNSSGSNFYFWEEAPALGIPRLGNGLFGDLSPAASFFRMVHPDRALSLFAPLSSLALLFASLAFFRRLGMSLGASLYGALAWVSVGQIAGHVQHPTVMETIVWLPCLLFCWQSYLNSGRSRWLLLGTFCIYGFVTGAFVQQTFYLGLITAGYVFSTVWTVRGEPRQALKRALAGATIAVAGFLLSSPYLLAALEFGGESQRNSMRQNFADSDRNTPALILRSLAGESFLVSKAPLLHDSLYPLTPTASLLTTALAIFACVRLRLWGLALGSLFFLIGSLGNSGPVGPLLNALFPQMNVCRAPARMILPAGFLLAWMASRALDHLTQSHPRAPRLRFLAVGWLLVLFWFLYRGEFKTSPENIHQIPQVLRQAEPRVAFDFRSVPFFHINKTAGLGIPTLSLYDNLVLRSYFEAIFSSQLGSLHQEEKVNLAVRVSLLPIVRPELPLMRSFNLRTMVYAENGQLALRPLPALGRFFVVPQVQLLPTPEERWKWAASTDWDPTQVALVEHPVELPQTTGEGAHLKVLDDNPDRQLLEVEGGGGLLVTSAQLFPGWTVTVDGKPAQAVRANLALRGVVVPPGRHRVEWTYLPTWLPKARVCLLLGLLLLPGLLLFRFNTHTNPAKTSCPDSRQSQDPA